MTGRVILIRVLGKVSCKLSCNADCKKKTGVHIRMCSRSPQDEIKTARQVAEESVTLCSAKSIGRTVAESRTQFYFLVSQWSCLLYVHIFIQQTTNISTALITTAVFIYLFYYLLQMLHVDLRLGCWFSRRSLHIRNVTSGCRTFWYRPQFLLDNSLTLYNVVQNRQYGLCNMGSILLGKFLTPELLDGRECFLKNNMLIPR